MPNNLNNDNISPEGIDKVAGGLIDIKELTNIILSTAVDMKASDIHLEPREEGLLVRYRIDGILRSIMCVKKFIETNLVFRIKLEAKMRIDEHLAPQDGRIGFVINGHKLDTRISTIPTALGEKIVIRLLSKEGTSFELEALGFQGRELELLENNYKKPYGMILSAGPTGSGKTTTLYAILKLINTSEKNITTIEDPIEYLLEGVNQIQTNSKAKLTFANGLRAILRQDPNVIMIGEIRDDETAKIAINASMTGHLVLSTIHTNDAVGTIPRLIDMGIDPFLIASTVNLIIAQRLTRRLCEKCKQKYTLEQADFDDVNKVRPDVATLIKIGEEYYKAVGCDECNSSGYSGRIGIFEVLQINEPMRKIITKDVDIDDLLKIGRDNGFVLMIEDGIRKAREGVTSLDELMRVTVMKE